MITHYFNTNHIPICIDRIKQELETPIWYINPVTGTERSELSVELREHLQSVLPFQISDAGFMRRRPNSMYHPHIDLNRTFAVNLPLSEEHDEAGTYVIKLYSKINDGNIEPYVVFKEKVNYIRDRITVLNVKQIHYIVNHSNFDRIILSIGCNDIPYNEIIKTIMKDIARL
jgi:hypothetical protein